MVVAGGAAVAAAGKQGELPSAGNLQAGASEAAGAAKGGLKMLCRFSVRFLLLQGLHSCGHAGHATACLCRQSLDCTCKVWAAVTLGSCLCADAASKAASKAESAAEKAPSSAEEAQEAAKQSASEAREWIKNWRDKA